MAKIDPASLEKDEQPEDEGKLQVVCGLGVMLTSKGTVEVIEIKGMPLPEPKMALSMLGGATSEMQAHVISDKVYGALMESIKNSGIDGNKAEGAPSDPPNGPPKLGVHTEEDK